MQLSLGDGIEEDFCFPLVLFGICQAQYQKKSNKFALK